MPAPTNDPAQIIDRSVNHAAHHVAIADRIEEIGVPGGGTTGQVLSKTSNDDHDLEWADASGGGSSFASVLKFGNS